MKRRAAATIRNVGQFSATADRDRRLDVIAVAGGVLLLLLTLWALDLV